jgi:RimJ/RimL family protein N-acetyltransferase
VPVTNFQLGLELLETGLLIGGCALKRPSADAPHASLGYVVNPDYQRQGYATEAAIALIEFGFEQLKLSYVSAF